MIDKQRQESGTSHDVVIVGGGPVGSTVSTLLRKYDPTLDVLVIEKEKFPRPHVGESQLPGVSAILAEMGCWDKVEAADFPIKIGASLTWGKNSDRWDFDFYPSDLWRDEPRPAQFAGQRASTAFQVDRAKYDDILLRHAESVGVEVREETQVTDVLVDGDRIEGLVLDDGDTVTGRYYVDGSGAVGLLRRAIGVEVDAPKELRNIAIWDYWENTGWAVEIGTGATRVQVRSLPYGWLWFIPLGPTRTSIGLICPSEYYRASGKSPEQLYEEAIATEKHVRRLTEGGTRRGTIETCKDWSHLADRLVGENWFLAGEAAGFADPILAAGMALAHSSARDVAYTILELERARHDPAWLKQRYDKRNRTNIRQHIRFAQYWYSANGCFTDLQDYCAAIANESGLSLSPQRAWEWLSQGGFVSQNLETPAAGSYDFGSAKEIVGWLEEQPCERLFEGYNVFELSLNGAVESWFGQLEHGNIERVKCLTRGEHTLPLHSYFGLVVAILGRTSDVVQILEVLQQDVAAKVPPPYHGLAIERFFQTLDAMIQEGWVTRRRNNTRPFVTRNAGSGVLVRTSAEGEQAVTDAGVPFTSNLELDGE